MPVYLMKAVQSPMCDTNDDLYKACRGSSLNSSKVPIGEAHGTFCVSVANGFGGAGAALRVWKGHALRASVKAARHTLWRCPAGVVCVLVKIALPVKPLFCPPHVICRHQPLRPGALS